MTNEQCYYLGEGVTQDVMEALRLYKQAAELDEADAFNALGDCYRRGIVSPDEEHMLDEDLLKASCNMYEQASNKGCLIAKCNLADAYRYGEGVEVDLEKSFRLYSEVAGQNHDEGQYLLAEAYELGVGVAVDLIQAVRYYRRAAAQGYSRAEEKLQILRHAYREAVRNIFL